MRKYANELRRELLPGGIYMALYLICAIFLSIGNRRNGRLCCMSDIVLDSAYKNMFLLAPAVVIIMIKYFSSDFRVSVILRYGGAYRFICHIWKKILIFALFFSVGQIILVCMAGLPAGIHTNWGSPDSYICMMYGVIMKNPVPVWQVIMSVWTGIFMELILLGAGLCVLWLLLETPIAGLVVTICLAVIESTSKTGFRIFFSRLGIEIGEYVTRGNNILSAVIYSVVSGMGIMLFMIWIINKKDIMRRGI